MSGVCGLIAQLARPLVITAVLGVVSGAPQVAAAGVSVPPVPVVDDEPGAARLPFGAPVPSDAVATVRVGATNLAVRLEADALVFTPIDALRPVDLTTVVVDVDVPGQPSTRVAVRYGWAPPSEPLWASPLLVGAVLGGALAIGLAAFLVTQTRQPRLRYRVVHPGPTPAPARPWAPAHPPLRVAHPERSDTTMPLSKPRSFSDDDPGRTASPLPAHEDDSSSSLADLVGASAAADHRDEAPDVSPDGRQPAASASAGRDNRVEPVLRHPRLVIETGVPIPTPNVSSVGLYAFASTTTVRLDGEPDPRLPADVVRLSAPTVLDPHRRTWVFEDGPLLALGACSEKRLGRGEDADPSMAIAIDRTSTPRWMIAAYDGLGGAGSRNLPTVDDAVHTEAFVASRLARTVTETWFWQAAATGQPLTDLATPLAERLDSVADECGAGDGSAIVSSLHRTLPTTFVGVFGTGRDVDVMWAGDSRAYILTPTRGLQQLTVDHVRRPDTMEQLRNGAPMTNVVEAWSRFRIDRRRVPVPKSQVLYVVATDGMFDYIETPGMLEWHILDTLQNAADAGSWVSALIVGMSERSGDDCSFALIQVGYPGFDELKAAFRKRHTQLRRTQRDPFGDSVLADDELAAARDTAWAEYGPTYEQLISTPPQQGANA